GRSKGFMVTNLWIDLRKTNWNRLDLLVNQAESSGVKSLSQPDLRDLGLLYRQAAADLSAVRADPTSRTLEAYLNRLVGRAHNLVYSGRRVSFWSLWEFLAHGYPRLLRRMLPYIWLATAVFLACFGLGMLITLLRPDFAALMLGPQMMDKINHHQMWTDAVLSMKPQAASGIMTNNMSVCFMTFAAGITAGLGTLFFLFNNGLQIGAVLACCAQHKMAGSLLAFMVSHGALEIPSIMLAGAAGLRLGAGILFPGQLRRRDALAKAGSEAVQLVSATIPLLIIAGCFEGFLSPTHAPVAVKCAVGAVLFTGLCVWWGEGGRKLHSATAPATLPGN
ncbi:MAG: stage II sporulation protein M, partial [Janthinobacterium lividum]